MGRRSPSEISVFSTSAVDLFCSALGVFMVIFFMAMSLPKPPPAPAPAPVPAPEPVPSPAPAPVPEPPRDPVPKPGKVGGEDSMMIFTLRWTPGECRRVGCPKDIDLHVHLPNRPPEEAWNFYNKHSAPGQAGGLVLDDVGNHPDDFPCREVWTAVGSEDGEYKFYVNVYHGSSSHPLQNGPQVKWQFYSDDLRVPPGTVRVSRCGKSANNPANLHYIGKAVVEGGKVVSFSTEP